MNKNLTKVPWGVLAGVFGILCFYCVAGVIGAQFVFAQVNGQTGQVATIFDSWWQILLFAVAIVTAIGFIGSLALFILGKSTKKRETEQ